MDGGLRARPPLWVPCPPLSRPGFDALSPRGSLCQGPAEGPPCPSDPAPQQRVPGRSIKLAFREPALGNSRGRSKGASCQTGRQSHLVKGFTKATISPLPGKIRTGDSQPHRGDGFPLEGWEHLTAVLCCSPVTCVQSPGRLLCSHEPLEATSPKENGNQPLMVGNPVVFPRVHCCYQCPC